MDFQENIHTRLYVHTRRPNFKEILIAISMCSHYENQSKESHFKQLQPWFLYKMVTQNMLRTSRMKENKSFRKKIRFVTALVLIECFNISNNSECSLRVHLFMRYHLIYVAMAATISGKV